MLFIRQSRETRNKELNLVVRPNGKYLTVGGMAFEYKKNMQFCNNYICFNIALVYLILKMYVIFNSFWHVMIWAIICKKK